MAELFGKVTGCCKGKGGSMHLGDLAKGMVPAVAIVGGGLPIATGHCPGLQDEEGEPRRRGLHGGRRHQRRELPRGRQHGRIWDLPVLYVVENNLYGASTHVSQVMKVPHIADRAAAYGIPGMTVDGNDVLAVYEAAKEARERARAGQGPDAPRAADLPDHGPLPKGSLPLPAGGREEAGPGQRAHRQVRQTPPGRGLTDQKGLEAIRDEVKAEVERAVEKAMADPLPKPEDALEDMFV